MNTSQLRQSAGQVRCGYCENIFDAFDTLTSHIPKNSNKLLKTPSPNKKTFEDHLKNSSIDSKVVTNVAQDDQKDEINLYETEFRMNPKPRGIVYFLLSLFFIVLASMQWAFLKDKLSWRSIQVFMKKL